MGSYDKRVTHWYRLFIITCLRTQQLDKDTEEQLKLYHISDVAYKLCDWLM